MNPSDQELINIAMRYRIIGNPEATFINLPERPFGARLRHPSTANDRGVRGDEEVGFGWSALACPDATHPTGLGDLYHRPGPRP